MGNRGLQISEYLAAHDQRTAGRSQLGHKMIHPRQSKFGERYRPDEGSNMMLEVLATLANGGIRGPRLRCSRSTSGTLRRRWRCPLAGYASRGIRAGLRCPRCGCPAGRKRLHMSVAVLIDVIDDPGFPRLAALGRPLALTNGHGISRERQGALKSDHGQCEVAELEPELRVALDALEQVDDRFRIAARDCLRPAPEAADPDDRRRAGRGFAGILDADAEVDGVGVLLSRRFGIGSPAQ